MKKIFFLFVALLLLAGCAQQKPFVQQNVQPTTPAEPVTPYAETPPVVDQQLRVDQMPETAENRGEYASHQSPDLQKAFTDGMKLCNYKLTDEMLGDILIRAWILSSDRFRLEKAVPGTRISTVYDQLIVHSWDDRTKQGVKLSLNDLADIKDERVAGMDIPKTPAEATAGARDIVCVTSTALGEDILDVPDNVNFVSLGTLAKQ